MVDVIFRLGEILKSQLLKFATVLFVILNNVFFVVGRLSERIFFVRLCTKMPINVFRLTCMYHSGRPFVSRSSITRMEQSVRDTPSLLCFRRRLKTSLSQSSFDC